MAMPQLLPGTGAVPQYTLKKGMLLTTNDVHIAAIHAYTIGQRICEVVSSIHTRLKTFIWAVSESVASMASEK